MSEDSIELGGNIVLTGFRAIEPGMLVVVKKIVGNYAKTMSEKASDFEKIEVTLDNGTEKKIKAVMTAGGAEIVSETADKNLFFALDRVLREITDKI